MNPAPAPDPAQLHAEALARKGALRLAWLLGRCVPIADLRALAKRFGLTPKGFRLERADAMQLGELLAALELPEVFEAACTALAAVLAAPAQADRTAAPASDYKPILELKDKELAQCRAELGRAREIAQRQRDKEAELTRRLAQAEEESIRMHKVLDELRHELAARPGRVDEPGPAAQRQRDLERDLADANTIEEALRFRLSEQQARIQQLEAEVEALAALVPKGRRKAPPPPPPAPRERVRVPHFTPGFYRSLEGKERRSIERAIQAVFLYCTEGPSYPGLEVKQLEGMSLWSMRAALKLRVYFTLRPDGDVDIEALADREDQHTLLRRWKDR